MKPTDIRIDQVTFGYEDFRYRTPIKFGGTALDRVTLLNVTIAVSTRGWPAGTRLWLDAARQCLVVSVEDH